jgi:hypothetical protein
MPSMGPAAESGAFSLLSLFYKNRMSTGARCIMGPVATRRSFPSFPFSTKIVREVERDSIYAKYNYPKYNYPSRILPVNISSS